MRSIKLTPIVLFAYKRIDKVKTCLESLEKCKDADKTNLIIFCDGYKGETDKQNVLEVQNYIRIYSQNKHSFCNVYPFFKEKNHGLANSIVSGVTKVMQEYGSAIIVEDDLIVSGDFIQYMNAALKYYKDDKRVGTIGAFTPISNKIQMSPGGVLKSRMGCCWGWATWYDRWKNIDWNIDHCLPLTEEEQKSIDRVQYGFCAMLKQQAEGKIDSWAVRYDYYSIKNDLWTIYPNKSKVASVGFDSSSTHAKDKHDKRKKVTAEEDAIYMTRLEDVIDVSIPMRAYFKPGIIEKIRYFFVMRRYR